MQTIESAASTILAAIGTDHVPVAVFSKNDLNVAVDYGNALQEEVFKVFLELNTQLKDTGLVALPCLIQEQQTLIIVTKDATGEELNNILPVMLSADVMSNLEEFGASSVTMRMKL